MKRGRRKRAKRQSRRDRAGWWQALCRIRDRSDGWESRVSFGDFVSFVDSVIARSILLPQTPPSQTIHFPPIWVTK